MSCNSFLVIPTGLGANSFLSFSVLFPPCWHNRPFRAPPPTKQTQQRLQLTANITEGASGAVNSHNGFAKKRTKKENVKGGQ